MFTYEIFLCFIFRSLLNSIWSIFISGLLEAEKINKSYGGAEIKKVYENLCLYFYPIGSLSFLADIWIWNPRFLQTFTDDFRSSLSENITFC